MNTFSLLSSTSLKVSTPLRRAPAYLVKNCSSILVPGLTRVSIFQLMSTEEMSDMLIWRSGQEGEEDNGKGRGRRESVHLLHGERGG